MWTLPEAPDVLASFAALLGSAAAFYGVCVAHMGLRTWQRQRDSVLAARVAAVMYKYKDSLHHVRFPYLTVTDREKFPDLTNQADVTPNIRLARWQNSRDLLGSLRELIAEADIAWNEKASPCFKEIMEMEQEFASDVLKLCTLERRTAYDNDAYQGKMIPLAEWERRTDKRSLEVDRLSQIASGIDSDEMGARIDVAFRPLIILLKSKI